MHRSSMTGISVLLTANLLWAAGEEQVGNDPINAANYDQAPAGVLEVINDVHRVYRSWVNGNENFYFAGDAIALNAAIENFSKMDSEKLEVVLRPGPVSISTFGGDQHFAYNWNLHLIGGIAGLMRRHEFGDVVWPEHPMLYVYVGGRIQLSELDIPSNVDVLQISDLKQRYAAALKSNNKSVRGWTCGSLARLDAYCDETMKQVAGMLEDQENWVRLNAAGALVLYGHEALAVKSQLEAAGKTDDKRLAQRVRDSIAEIESAKPNRDAKETHNKMLAAIAAYCDSRD